MVGGQRYTRTFDTEAEGLAYVEAVRSRGRRLAGNAPTLATYAPDWIDYRETHGLLHHAESERALLRCVVREWDRSDDPLRSLKRRHVAEYVTDLASAGDLARGSIKHRLRLIKRCLDAAADAGLVSGNAAADVRVPRMRRQEAAETWTYLEQHEIDDVIALDDYRARKDLLPLRALSMRALWATAIYTGLRRSELWHLTWANVVLTGPRPCIRVRAPLKSERARRDVPLLPVPLTLLRELEPHRSTLYVWPSPSRGRRRDDDDAGWRDHWGRDADGRSVVKRAGILRRAGHPRHARFHDLRHTCASHLVMGTWGVRLSLHEAMQWLGHSSIVVTQRYAHLAPDGLAGKVARLSDLRGDLRGETGFKK